MNQKAKDYIRRNTLDLESDNRMDSTGYVQYAISEAKAYAAIAIAEEGMRQKTIEAFKFAVDGLRDYIRFHDDMGHLWDERMRRCDTERVGRVVNHFQNDDNAYFMVINAPNTEVHLITGEIGICSLLTGQRGHFELPRVSYQTSKGNVVLFPDEIMPVDINLLQQEINEGYIMLSDGRYLPPKEAVQQCYNAFGIRVGLGDNWEDIYDGWNKEMK